MNIEKDFGILIDNNINTEEFNDLLKKYKIEFNFSSILEKDNDNIETCSHKSYFKTNEKIKEILLSLKELFKNEEFKNKEEIENYYKKYLDALTADKYKHENNVICYLNDNNLLYEESYIGK